MSLTKEEQELVYNIEVLGMKPSRAAELAGIDDVYKVVQRPEIIAAKAKLRDAIRKQSEVTRADIIVGIKDAIALAGITGEPMAQIRGWVEIAALTGLDRPKRLEIGMAGSLNDKRKELAALPDAELLQIEGADVIDADFYVVSDPEN